MTWSPTSQPAAPLASSNGSPVQQPPLDLFVDSVAELESKLEDRDGIEESSPGQLKRWGRLRGLSLRAKATLLALAIGALPVIATGGIAYTVANQSITQQITQDQTTLAEELANAINRFMFERYGDIQVLANLPSFRNSKFRAITTSQENIAILDKYVEAYGIYDSIAVYGLDGNLIVESSKVKSPANINFRDYFQAVLKTQRPFISQPQASKVTNISSVFLAAPVIDSGTGKMIAVIRTRMPVSSLEEIMKDFGDPGDEYHVADANGKFFIALEKDQVDREITKDFPGLEKFRAIKQSQSIVTVDAIDGVSQLVGYAPTLDLGTMPNPNWSAVLGTDTSVAFQTQRQLLLTLLVGTAMTTLLVGAIAALIASRATRPIIQATNAVAELGQGKLDTRIPVQGEDELAVLGTNINQMADQIQDLLAQQAAEVGRIEQARREARAEADASAEEQRQQKEFLQRRALELLIEVDPVSRGDLTIRAKVTEDEIGTVADSYNATVGSLRKIVSQVQTAAKQVVSTTSTSEGSVKDLSLEALRQAEDITAVLDRVEEMSQSIRLVATNAEQAEAAAQESAQAVKEGDDAMNRTVSGILAIRETVAETSKKVKRLGESSQKISKVVNLISSFADQTNLLALNAAIEAARAGEEGRGFAVVADEVRSLARQSAEATAEIEKLVAEIQTETNEVVAAMESGTAQVVTGTTLVDEARQSLNKIATSSTQIYDLVEAIAAATIVQSQASVTVTQTMTEVAEIANKTSQEANQVSASFKDLLAVAQELQASVGQFKIS
ncbi:MAG: methyl-accepting chemotaxis protein [Leptolyngbyaceae bacterium]|nr:methyl-accepting chemotaxis protein [Leptolyngbyaceae bacterium]